MRILLVEDDNQIAEDIREILIRQTYVVDHAGTLGEAMDCCTDNSYDCAIVDWMLPDGEGTDVVKELRDNYPETKILMLTARTMSADIIRGLNTGADDYLTKPFDMNIMLARLRSLLRRKETGENPLIEVGNLRINLNSHSVTNKGREIPLSPKEYALLEYLAIHANQAIERITLLEHVWGDNTDLFSNTVDVHIRYLRQKISDDQNPKIIQTVKNVGYILVRP